MTICLVSTGQPSTNPRLVKEADALVEAGYAVHVVGAHWADWAEDSDRTLLASRRWTMTLVDWRRDRAPALFARSRVRHWAARQASRVGALAGPLAASALSRVGPELRREALARPAALYIAHNLGALPAAHAAARRHGAALGFDAEDFHSGQLSRPSDARAEAYTRRAEQQLLPRCTYVTAAAPGIAEAYRDLCGIPLPTTILNVFPLSDRPAACRPDRPDNPVRLYWFSQTIGPDRGLEDAVRALGLLKDCPVELHLRGRWQAGYEEALRAMGAASGVDQARIVSHAPAAADAMVRLAATYDVGLALEPPVSANNDVLLSNKVFTYLLGGTAVLGTRTRGQSTLIPELGRAGAWYQSGDPASLASALRPWLEDRAALARARDTAWRLGDTRFNWDVEKRKFLALVMPIAGPVDTPPGTRTRP